MRDRWSKGRVPLSRKAVRSPPVSPMPRSDRRHPLHAYSPFLLVACIALCSCSIMVERDDKASLRRQCDIPRSATLVEYRGYPAVVGFGQREGLHIEGRFQIEKSGIGPFESDAVSRGWKSLPIPDEVLAKIPFEFSLVRLGSKKGLYRCHTAGDNVLHAKQTRDVSTVETPLDIIVSVYDSESGVIGAAVASGY
jgi:hypothetical protein